MTVICKNQNQKVNNKKTIKTARCPLQKDDKEMKKPKQRFLEGKLDEMIERIHTDGSKLLKEHYNKKSYDVDVFHSSFVCDTGKKYKYGYDITFFVNEKP